MEGNSSNKQTPGRFKAVGGDQLLEQTINRSQKSHSGIIGITRQKAFVAQWEIIYHEMLSVSNLHRSICGSRPSVHDSIVHYEFNAAETTRAEKNFQAMVKFVDEKEIHSVSPVSQH